MSSKATATLLRPDPPRSLPMLSPGSGWYLIQPSSHARQVSRGVSSEATAEVPRDVARERRSWSA